MLRAAVVMSVVGVVGGWASLASAWEEVIATPTPVRAVSLNLVIDDLETETPIQLKRKSTGVVAETIKPLPEKLQFEVVVQGPHGTIPVCFPVPPDSPVCAAYQMYKDTDPAKILEAMDAVQRPILRVVAVKTLAGSDTFVAGNLTKNTVATYWKPFYEVALPDADCAPVLVPVPREDVTMHALARKTVNITLAPQDVVVVADLSGCLHPQCTSDGSCAQLDPPQPPCHCEKHG